MVTVRPLPLPLLLQGHARRRWVLRWRWKSREGCALGCSLALPAHSPLLPPACLPSLGPCPPLLLPMKHQRLMLLLPGAT